MARALAALVVISRRLCRKRLQHFFLILLLSVRLAFVEREVAARRLPFEAARANARARLARQALFGCCIVVCVRVWACRIERRRQEGKQHSAAAATESNRLPDVHVGVLVARAEQARVLGHLNAQPLDEIVASLARPVGVWRTGERVVARE